MIAYDELHPDRRRDCGNCRGHGSVLVRRATRLDEDGNPLDVETFRAPCSRCDGTGVRQEQR